MMRAFLWVLHDGLEVVTDTAKHLALTTRHHAIDTAGKIFTVTQIVGAGKIGDATTNRPEINRGVN